MFPVLGMMGAGLKKKTQSKKEKGGNFYSDILPKLGITAGGLKKTQSKKEKGGGYGLEGYGEDENIDVLNQLKNVNMDGGSLKRKEKSRKTKGGTFNFDIVPDSTSQMAAATFPNISQLKKKLAWEQSVVNGPDMSGGKFKRASIKDFIIKKKKKIHIMLLNYQFKINKI